MNLPNRNAYLFAFGIPTLYALGLRMLFGMTAWNEFLEVMSIAFLFLSPVIIGFLTIYFSPAERVGRLTYRILAPWIPIFFYLVITLALAIEGWACWLMVLPLFLIAASVGGLIGGALREWVDRRNSLRLSLLVLLPLVIGPIEGMIGALPATYQAYTYIDIEAPAEKIWDQVTRVAEIEAADDSGWLNRLLGFPRPVRAELVYEGVGAYREAVFTNGLVFHVTVTEYEDNRKMVFDIHADPHEIPSTPLDEHVVVGGQFFDVLEGTYELEDLGAGRHRLHLSSSFEIKTTFNFYAGWWGRWIMKDIQANILRVEKRRAEGKLAVGALTE